MADLVTIPATGSGDATPKVSTQQVSADSSQVQDVALATVAAGVRTRVSAAAPLPVDNAEMPAAAVIGDTDANPTTTQIASVLQGWTGSVWQRLKSGPNSDGIGANGFLNILLMLFNGTTYDRIRGDAANGMDVDVTRVGGVVAVNDNSGSLTVDAPAGTPVAVRFSDGASLQTPVRVDNQAFTDNASNVTPVAFIFDEVAGTALTEDDAAAARIDSKRAQVGVIEDATTRGQRMAVTAANAAKVDGSAVTQPVSIATNTPTEVRATTGAAPTAFTATTSTQVFASNANRKLFTVYNNSDKDLFLMLASAAVSVTSYHVKVPASGGYFETANYSGEIRGIMSASIVSGQVNPGEFT